MMIGAEVAAVGQLDAGVVARPGVRGIKLDALTLGAFVVTQVLGAAFLVDAGDDASSGWAASYLGMVDRWDGEFYRRLAESGHPAPGTDEGPLSALWAFLPLYPLLARAVMSVTGLPFEPAGVLVSLASGCVAAILVGRLLRGQVGEREGLIATVVAFCAPAAPALQIAYPDSLALAVLTGLLLSVVNRRYWLASALAIVLGLTRPIALPLVVVGITAAVVELRARPFVSAPRERLPLVALVASCALAGPLWPILVAIATSRLDGYAIVGAYWWPDQTIHLFDMWSVLMGSTSEPYAAQMLLTGAPLLPLIALLALTPAARRLSAVLRAWCVAYALFLTMTVQVTPALWRYELQLIPMAAVVVGAALEWPGRGVSAREDSIDRRMSGKGALPLRWIATLGVSLVVLGLAAQRVWVMLILASSGRIP